MRSSKNRPVGDDMRRIGGWAAAVLAGTFVFGIALFATVLGEYTEEGLAAADAVAFLQDHQIALHSWYIVTLIVFGLALVPVVLALHRRVGASSSLVRIATVFGLIWSGLVLGAGMIANVGVSAVAEAAENDAAAARSLWSALDAVQNGLGGGNEVVGGAWVLLISVAAFRAGSLPRPLNVLGAAAGVAGLVTVVPGLTAMELVFGLGLIAWFVGVAASLLRGGPGPSTRSRAERTATGPLPQS